MSRFLLEAAGNGDLKKVQDLLTKGADLGFRHKGTGRTALSEATIGGFEEIVKLLLARGADVDTLDTAMGLTPLGWAVECGHPNIAQVLIGAGANVNVATPEYLLTPLLIASQKGDLASVEILLKAGAQVNAPAADGRRPLKVAQDGKHLAVVKALVAAGGVADSPLPEPTVIPWPPVDASGATVDYAAAEKVLHSFLFAMNRYERAAAQIDKKLATANSQILSLMKSVFDTYCTPAKRPYGRAGSYQIPPEYDPEDEVLLEVNRVSPRRTELITRRGRDRSESLYVAAKKGDRWLLESRKRRLIGARWSTALL